MTSSFLNFDHRDISEQIYIAKFSVLALEHGIGIGYATDRAALDLGLHLTTRKNEQVDGVTARRVWFQFKGQSAKTLSQVKFYGLDTISQQVEISHLRQWANYGEVVYLVVYLEAPDQFFAIDIQKLIAERWGDKVYDDAQFLKKDGTVQEKVNVHLPKAETEVNDAFWEKLGKHRSMRIDLASYQGKPLTHIEDFQSKILGIMGPELYEELIGQLLVAYDFRPAAIANDVAPLYPDAGKSGDKVMLMLGKLFEPYQYDHYLTRELLGDEDGFREDGQQFRAHGPCAVIIHSDVRSRPDPDGISKVVEFLVAQDIKHLLVFVNHYMDGAAAWDKKEPFNCFPEFSEGVGGADVECFPIHLEDLGKNILLSPAVHLQFREDLRWLSDEVADKIRAGEYHVLSEDEYLDELVKSKK